MTEIKICGLTCEEDIRSVNNLAVDYAGFVFSSGSKRNISPEHSQTLLSGMDQSIKSVALFVDESPSNIENVLNCFEFDYIQLHGNESVEQVRKISTIFRKPIIKAIGVTDKVDWTKISEYYCIADKLLFDAKLENLSGQPGGNGKTFNWDLLKNFKAPIPWVLAGGLNINNVTLAIELLSPDCVDVSSGVEDYPGKKNFDKIFSFVNAIRRNEIDG